MDRNTPCWCGSGKKWKKCHYPEHGPVSREALREEYLNKFKILIKTEEQIAGIRRSGHLAAKILDLLSQRAVLGVTTQELNRYAEELCREAGAIAAPLHFGSPPFPASICTSPNEVVCHGIPDSRPLQEGDILNIDVTTILDGYYGDCSRMVLIGKVNAEKQRVVDTSYTCLMRAIEAVRPGLPICELGRIMTQYAESKGCGVVYQFVAHGVGVDFHEPPQIPHNLNSIRIPLVEGMTFTIEPMINAGKPEVVIDRVDGWTARTVDGRPSAQWEHTLLVTETGYEILTPWVR